MPPSDGEAIEILRRLEPAIGRLHADVADLRKDVADLRKDAVDLRKDVVKLGQDLAEMKGRMVGIDAQLRLLPTVWTLAGLIIAIFGFAFALLRFGVPRS